VVLAAFARFAHWKIGEFGTTARMMGPVLVTLWALVFVVLLVVALRRKVTLTSDELVMYQTWRTQRVPLRDIVWITSGKLTRRSLSDSVVQVALVDGQQLRTLGLGTGSASGVAVLRQAVRAAGGRLGDRPPAPVAPTAAPAPAAARMRRFRVGRDLLVVGCGLCLLVFGIATSASTAVYVLAAIMIVVFGAAAQSHRRQSAPLLWSRRNRILGCLVGFVLGAYALVYASAAFGSIGEQVSIPATACQPAGAGHFVCTASMTLSDGSTEHYPVDLTTGDGTPVTLYRPPAALLSVMDPQTTRPWQTGVAYLVVGLLLIGQAVTSLTVLLTARSRQPA
jgi:hypothetical protein